MAYVKSNYQTFRGNPEKKLFYLMNNFIGGINTEFTDDKSSVADFESVINFDMDRLGTAHKRQGFGELTALSDIFNKLNQDLIPVVKNRTDEKLNPEEDNDNIVYMGLLQNDNNCFRNLAGFSGKNAFREYQKMYGFQNNTFKLLLITTNIANNQPLSSHAWYYKCTLPEYILQLEPTSDTNYMKNGEYNIINRTEDTKYIEGKEYFKLENNLYIILIENKDYGVGENITGDIYERTELIEGTDYNVGDQIETAVYTPKDNISINGYKIEMPILFNWDRNLMNMDSIEYDNKIYFTNNNKGLVIFDMETEINSNSALGNAFTYAGFAESGITNKAFKPSAFEVSNFGFNLLAGADPIHYIEDNSIASDSIQGMAIFNKDFKPTYDTIPAGQKFMVGIYYTGTHSDFTLTFTDVTDENNRKIYDNNGVTITANSTYSTTGFKVYEVQFLSNPSSKLELKVEMQNSNISPQYDYFNVGSIDAETPSITSGINVGECGLIFMNERAVFYKKDAIFFSQIRDFTYVPSNNYVRLSLSPTDEITKICYFKKSYIIFTKEQIWKMSGSYSNTISDLTIELVNESIGCHAGHTVVPIDNTLYFASPRGLYSLKSNQFVEGYENVGELDVKVKTLTSDYTLYAEDRENPAIRYNGINEHAYAFRYKDKYILFYNNYNDKGDYAAANGLDALTYQFEIGSYTTYRFKEKPTFLFMVDNAIETLSTVKVKEEFTDENVLFDYDFTSSLVGGKVVDRSGNGNNGSLVGNALVNSGAGIKLNGYSSYGTISDFNGTITGGLDIQIETKCEELNGAYLIDLQQSSESISAQKTSGSFETDKPHNYYARLEYTITPNPSTKKDTVSYKLYYLRNGSVPSNTGNLRYTISGSEGAFKSNITKAFNISSGSQLVDSGTFTITRNSDGSYSSRWSLNISSSYVTTSTRIVKGGDVNLSGQYWATTTFNWIQLGFANFVARATDTGCTITYTPMVRLTSGLRVGNRKLTVNIDGQEDEHTVYVMSYATSSSPYTANGTSKTISLSYSGLKTISINMKFAANFTRNSDGKYYGTLSINEQSQDMPSVTTETTYNTTNYSMSGGTQISFANYGKSSYRQIALKINGNNDQLAFIMTSENGDATVLTDTGIGLLGKHTWRVRTVNTGDCMIYKDGTIIKQQVLDGSIFVNTNRTVNYIGTNRDRNAYYKGEIYNLSVAANDTTVMDYRFNEGLGNIANDSSAYKRNMTLYGINWIVINGLILTDSNSFVSIPKISEDVPFTNGFKIEFEGIINADNNIIRVIDLAKSYQSETSSIKFNSINVGFKNNKIAFNSTGNNGRTYRVEADGIDTTVSHKYKIDCVDTGNGYDITIYVGNTVVANNFFNYGGIADVTRSSDMIGKSNDSTEVSPFKGNLLNMKVTIYGSVNGVPVYRSAIYEFDTTPTDFGRPIYVELKTKGINLEYPQHMKKLKHTFIKLIGGDELSRLFFGLYVDGHLVNDPTKYAWHLDENGTVVLDYSVEENLEINGTLSLLGNILVDKTRLDESKYETIKLIIPKKGKNFALHIYGDSEEFLIIDSFGMVCKLGKVKQG